MKTIPKTTAKTKGFSNGLPHGKAQVRRNANQVLQCDYGALQAEKDERARRQPHAFRSKRAAFDEEIIARYPLPVRVAIYGGLALTLSGVIPMALATLQIWLYETYGALMFLACMALDTAVIVWLVRSW